MLRRIISWLLQRSPHVPKQTQNDKHLILIIFLFSERVLKKQIRGKYCREGYNLEAIQLFFCFYKYILQQYTVFYMRTASNMSVDRSNEASIST